MKCRYCRTWNSEDEVRCINCHRALNLPLAQAPLMTHGYTRSATATALRVHEYSSAAAIPGPAAVAGSRVAPSESKQRPIQGLLFGPQDLPQVISIDWVQPSNPKRRSKAGASPSRRPARRRSPRQQPNPDQAWLDFLAATPPPRGKPLESNEDAMICCEAPVAHRTLRILAASVDAGVIAILLAVFVATVYIAGAGFTYGSKLGLGVLASIPFLLGILYKLLYSLADGESLGCQYTNIRLLSFEGQRPSRSQRVCRVVGAVVGLLPAGLGLIWGLGDEESLTWHDHMSNTFPTAVAAVASR